MALTPREIHLVTLAAMVAAGCRGCISFANGSRPTSFPDPPVHPCSRKLSCGGSDYETQRAHETLQRESAVRLPMPRSGA